MKNDYRIGDNKISIPPTVLFSVMGKIEDVRKAVTMDVKHEGDVVYVLGETFDELGGSEYYAMLGYVGNNVPKVDGPRAKRMYLALERAIDLWLIASCHDCSDGGLGVALVESSFSGGLGMEIDLRKVPANGIARNDNLFYSESASRFIVTISPQNKGEFEEVMKGNTISEIGRVVAGNVFRVVGLKGDVVVDADIYELKEGWKSTLMF
jgi:phosphoribosylformylglycinamidine synthase